MQQHATAVQPVVAAVQPIATAIHPVVAAVQPIAATVQPIATAVQPVAAYETAADTQPVAVADLRPGCFVANSVAAVTYEFRDARYAVMVK